jgi:hypothetical protein
MTDLISRTTYAAPAYSNMQQCLRVQAEAKPRGWFGRLVGKSPLHPDARAWFTGALGEREVAHVLAELGSNWSILREAVGGKASTGADYLVVGPPGIFTIAVKPVEGGKVLAQALTVSVDGTEADYIRTSMGQATRAAHQLTEASRTKVGVAPLLVLVGAASIRFGKQPPEIAVIRSTELRRWFLDRLRTVSDDTVSYFAHIALRSGNWNLHASVSGDVVRHVQRFERLQKEIADARKRLRWIATVAGGAVAIAASATVAGVLAN